MTAPDPTLADLLALAARVEREFTTPAVDQLEALEQDALTLARAVRALVGVVGEHTAHSPDCPLWDWIGWPPLDNPGATATPPACACGLGAALAALDAALRKEPPDA